MRISALKLYPFTTARRYGTVIAREGGEAKRTVTESYFWFLKVETDDGLTGWGEISDIEAEELVDPQEYGESLARFLVGRDPFDVQTMHRDFAERFDLEAGTLARYAVCGLDMALYDLQGKATGQPVYRLLGGAVRTEVVVSWVAYIRAELDLIREEIRERTAQGFCAFKLKVGVDIDLDEERLAVAREVAGKEASIKVDANEGWAPAEAVSNIRRLAKHGLAGVETPVPRDVPADIASVRRQVDVPILEHVATPEYGLALLKAEAVDVFNVATTGCGGLWPARQVVALAEAGGVGVLLGSTVEMGLGTLAQLHLAATVPNLTLPSDLIGPGMYRDEVLTAPVRYHEGKLRVPDGVGLGGNIDPRKLPRAD